MNHPHRQNSTPVLLATFIGYLAGLTVTLSILRSYLETKQLFVIGFSLGITSAISTLIRWYKR